MSEGTQGEAAAKALTPLTTEFAAAPAATDTDTTDTPTSPELLTVVATKPPTELGAPKDVEKEVRLAFTSHADSAFDVCFENILTSSMLSETIDNDQTSRLTLFKGQAVIEPSKHIELDIDIGADAKDWSAIQASEKLKPTEMELRRIEEVMGEVVKEMDYLREREMSLRDTNESTNERVKWFAIGTMAMLIALGGWQVIYLRAYFRYVARISEGGLPLTTAILGRSILFRHYPGHEHPIRENLKQHKIKDTRMSLCQTLVAHQSKA